MHHAQMIELIVIFRFSYILMRIIKSIFYIRGFFSHQNAIITMINKDIQQPTITHPPSQQNTSKQPNFYTELFQPCQINPVVHNTSLKQPVKDHNNSHITEFLLQKIKQSNNHPWQLLSHTNQLIQQLIKQSNVKYDKGQTYGNTNMFKKYRIKGSVYMENQSSVYIGEGTVIQHGAVIVGPCLIGSNCQIRKGAYLRGNAIIGNGTLIGNSCQIKNAILMDFCQIAHYNYIGDSILGIHAHFSAGAITSNYKLDGSLIKVVKIDEKQPILTGRNKLGALVGHNAEIGCNAILNPGSVIGSNSVVYPLVNWRGTLKAKHICKLSQQQNIVQRR